MKKLLIVLITFLFLFVFISRFKVNASFAVNEFTSGGVRLTNTVSGIDSNSFLVKSIPGGDDNIIISWVQNNTVRVQKVSSSGVKLWTSEGVIVATDNTYFDSYGIVTDGNGGAIIVLSQCGVNYPNFYITAQKVSSQGSLEWGGGVIISNAVYHKRSLTVLPDGFGGAFIHWYDGRFCDDVGCVGDQTAQFVQRINNSGTTLWTDNGLEVLPRINGGTLSIGQVFSSSDNGFFVQFYLPQLGSWYIQKIDSNGTALWAGNGIGGSGSNFVSDNSGGFFRVGGSGQVYAQRVNNLGSVLWTTFLTESSDTYADMPEVIIDGTYIITAWNDFRDDMINYYADIYTQKLDFNGNIQWQEFGYQITDNPWDEQMHHILVKDGGYTYIIRKDDWDNDLYGFYAVNSNARNTSYEGVGITRITSTWMNQISAVDIGSDFTGFAWVDNRYTNNEIFTQIQSNSYQIVKDALDLTFENINDNDVTLGSLYGFGKAQTYQGLVNGDTAGDVPITDFLFDSHSDIDLSNVTYYLDLDLKKIVLNDLNIEHSLYLQKDENYTAVLICPDAHILSDVQKGCTNGVVRTEADVNAYLVNVGGQDYWRVTDLVGTGLMNTSICPNSVVEPDEECDDGNVTNGDGCNSICEIEPGFTPTVTPTVVNTPSITGTIPPTITPTITRTPTPTITGTITITPSITGSITTTPSITTSVTGTIAITPTTTHVLTPTPTIVGTPVHITNVTVNLNIDGTNANICWKTNVPTISNIDYGEEVDGILTYSTDWTTIYSTYVCIELSNLEAYTPYLFTLNSVSSEGRSDDYNGRFNVGEHFIELPPTGNCIDIDPVTVNADKDIVLTYRTSGVAICNVNYGQNPSKYDKLGQPIETITNITHLSNLDTSSINDDLYYGISCNIISTSSTTSCERNDVITYCKFGDCSPVFTNILLPYFEVFTIPVTNVLIAANILAGYDNIFYGLLTFKKKKKQNPWGIIFDGQNKRPISFAIVKIFDNAGKAVKQDITDPSGRYGFVLDEGTYKMTVEHNDFSSYSNSITIRGNSGLLTIDIPLTLKNAKGRGVFFNFEYFLQKNLEKINSIFVIFGFIISLVAYIYHPIVINGLILIFYVYLGGYLLYSYVRRSWGLVVDNMFEKPIMGAFVRLFDPKESRQIDVQITDNRGRFRFKVAEGNYLLKADANGFVFPSAKADDIVIAKSGEKFIQAKNSDESIVNKIVLDES